MSNKGSNPREEGLTFSRAPPVAAKPKPPCKPSLSKPKPPAKPKLYQLERREQASSANRSVSKSTTASEDPPVIMPADRSTARPPTPPIPLHSPTHLSTPSTSAIDFIPDTLPVAPPRTKARRTKSTPWTNRGNDPLRHADEAATGSSDDPEVETRNNGGQRNSKPQRGTLLLAKNELLQKLDLSSSEVIKPNRPSPPRIKPKPSIKPTVKPKPQLLSTKSLESISAQRNNGSDLDNSKVHSENHIDTHGDSDAEIDSVYEPIQFDEKSTYVQLASVTPITSVLSVSSTSSNLTSPIMQRRSRSSSEADNSSRSSQSSNKSVWGDSMISRLIKNVTGLNVPGSGKPDTDANPPNEKRKSSFYREIAEDDLQSSDEISISAFAMPPKSPKILPAIQTSSPTFQYKSEKAIATSSPLSSPKPGRRRPSAPPPAPPSAPPLCAGPSVKPQRPPPPVCGNGLSSWKPSLSGDSGITDIKMTSSKSGLNTDKHESDDMYTAKDDARFAAIVERAPEITVEPSVAEYGSSDDVYMDPVASTLTCSLPRYRAPGLPSQSDTLRSQQSGSSHVYEDLASDTDDDFSDADRDPIDDPCSEFVDEIFDQEDIHMSLQNNTGSSSESDSEEAGKPEAPEETYEEKQAKKKEKSFKVAKELMTTEQEFVDRLLLLNIDFRKHISDATEEYEEPVIPVASMNKILNHLPQLSNFNQELLKDITDRVNNWETNPRIADVFVQKGAFLMLYTSYIQQFGAMTEELDRSTKEYPRFREKLLEFQRSERCHNMPLTTFMLEPIQRIPRYRLLLNEYEKYLPDDSRDKISVKEALRVVSKVADHANEAMKQNDSLKDLIQLQDLLIGDFKVIAPSRVLVKKGDVYKQSRKEAQSRTLLLFNDCLVITTMQSGGALKVRYVLSLNSMTVNKPNREDFQKEFTIITKKRSFAALAQTPRERDEWVSILESSIREREKNMRTYNRGHDKTGSKEFVLGETAPVWIPDDRVSMCLLCSEKFTMLNRRHHCRACGKVLCGNCSDCLAPLKYKDYKPCRVCRECYLKLLEKCTELCSQQNADSIDRDTMESDEVKPHHTLTLQEIRALFVSKDPNNVVPTKLSKPHTVYNEVHANEMGEISGYLEVHVATANKKKQWKKFWFVLKGNVLYKYNASEDISAIETKPLIGYQVKKKGVSSEGFGNVLFAIQHPQTDIVEPMLLRSETEVAADSWVEKLMKSTKP